jgi:hypothetical protein
MSQNQTPPERKPRNCPSSASIQEEVLIFSPKSQKQDKESTSCAYQEGNVNDNILDQQIHIGQSSDSLNFESENEDNNPKILPMLDKKDSQKLNGNMHIRALQTKKKSGSKLILGSKEEEEEACKKATEDTRNYLREMRRSQILENRESIMKSKEDAQSQEKEEEFISRKIILEKKNDMLSDRLMKNAHRGMQGIGYKDNQNQVNGYDSNMAHLLKEKFSVRRAIPEELESPSGMDMHGQMNMFTLKNTFGQKKQIGKRSWSENFSESIHFCEKHQFKKIEFICSLANCLREMCSLCILDHKEHINSIKHIHTHIKEQYQAIKNMDLKKIKAEINRNEEVHSKRLDCLYEEIKGILHRKIMHLKDDLISANNISRNALLNMTKFRDQFADLDKNPRMLEFTNLNCKTNTNLIKSCISFDKVNVEHGLSIERKLLLRNLKQNLGNNLVMVSPEMDFNTVEPDEPKYLHWFEWGERNLHLFDIINNTSRSIKLINNIKIPNFSRSIVTPKAKIFLLGGEDPEGLPKKEIYQFDLNKLDSDHILEPKALMPHQKYDFTLCYLNGFIYVICGKDTSSEAVNICEK